MQTLHDEVKGMICYIVEVYKLEVVTCSTLLRMLNNMNNGFEWYYLFCVMSIWYRPMSVTNRNAFRVNKWCYIVIWFFPQNLCYFIHLQYTQLPSVIWHDFKYLKKPWWVIKIVIWPLLVFSMGKKSFYVLNILQFPPKWVTTSMPLGLFTCNVKPLSL